MLNIVNAACGALNAVVFRSRSLAAVVLTLFVVKSAPAIDVSFSEVPGVAEALSVSIAGLSANGRILLVDYRGTNNEDKPMAFSVGQTIEPLPLNFQGAFLNISGDGSFLGGVYFGAAAKWRLTDGNRTILPGSFAYGLSYDGQIVVGSGGAGTPMLEAFRWSAQNGLQLLGDLQGRSRLKGSISVDSQALDVSSDGSVVIGVSSIASGLEGGFYWSNETGMISIGDLPGGITRAVANAVSGDGKTVVGFSDDAFGGQAVRWTMADGLVPLTQGSSFSRAVDASYDGSMIVGWYNQQDAVIWDHGNMRTVRSILEEHGVNLTGWQLTIADKISDDGRTIAGIGVNPAGKNVAWVVMMVPEPEPIPMFFIATAVLGYGRVGRRSDYRA